MTDKNDIKQITVKKPFSKQQTLAVVEKKVLKKGYEVYLMVSWCSNKAEEINIELSRNSNFNMMTDYSTDPAYTYDSNKILFLSPAGDFPKECRSLISQLCSMITAEHLLTEQQVTHYRSMWLKNFNL